MISPLPGVAAAKPGSAMTPLPGISAKIVDDDGDRTAAGRRQGEHVTGYLVLDQPWPSMLRGIWGDPGTVQRDLLVPVRRAGLVLRRRRRPLRRRRRDLGAGPHRRRDERVGAPDLDRRGGVGARRPHRGGRGRRGRGDRRHHRPGHLRVRRPAAPTTPTPRRDRRRAARRGGQGDLARSPSRARSTSCRSCPRPAAARSCAGCCATSPKTASSATRRRCSIPACSTRSGQQPPS